MESKRQSGSSILAKLMDLEGLRPKKQLERQRGQRRVVSESYLQDIALIGQRKHLSFDRLSIDVNDEMLYEKDSSEGIQTSSSSDEALEFYGKESDKIFQIFSFLNSTEKAHRDYSQKKLSRAPNEMEIVSYSTDVRRKGSCLEKRGRDCQRFRREAIGHNSMGSRGVAKKVAKQLQHSVWHDYSKEIRYPHNVVDCGFDKSTSFSAIRNSNCRRSVKFSVNKDWCLNLVIGDTCYCNHTKSADGVCCEKTPLISSDLNDFGEEDLFEDCFSAPQSPKTISPCSDVESVTNNAIERVLDELPDMLQEIDSFRNRECKNLDAFRQQIPYNAVDSDILHSAIHESEIKPEQAIAEAERRTRRDAEESRVLSYIADVLAELGHQCENKFRQGKSMEDLLSPCVFETLEKKYGKQSSWLKSHRKLLFDLVKCELSEIVCPQKGISTRRRHFSQEMIKDELLNILINQEKEANMDSYEKTVIDKYWLELDEDTQLVVKEIEEAFINELVEEIVKSEIC